MYVLKDRLTLDHPINNLIRDIYYVIYNSEVV